jgi:hypothetical protein
LIILASHRCDGARGRRRTARRAGLLLAGALAIGAAGCSQTATQTATTEAVIAGPLVLNSAPGAIPPATATTPGTAPVATVAPVPVTAAAPAPEPMPVAAAAPAPAPAQPVQPTALQTEPMPTTAAATATAEEGEFPNINKPPAQPGGTLLPAETRAQIIADLEKLRAGQQAPGSGGGGGNAADLATQAQTHGDAAIQQIEECSAEGALQNNPDCAPAD